MKPKGYPTGDGYYGWIPSYHKYILFSTDEEYYEIFDELAE